MYGVFPRSWGFKSKQETVSVFKELSSLVGRRITGEITTVGIWSRNICCMKFKWALINHLVVGEKVKEVFLEQVISALGFAILIGVWQKRKKVGENTCQKEGEQGFIQLGDEFRSQQSKGIEADEERQGRGPTQKAELMMGQDFTFMMEGIQGHGGGERQLCWSYGGFKAGSRRLSWKGCNG